MKKHKPKIKKYKFFNQCGYTIAVKSWSGLERIKYWEIESYKIYFI